MTEPPTAALVEFPRPPGDYLAPLAAEMAAFESFVASHDPDTPIPISRTWRLRSLADHLGGIHRWAAANVRTGVRSSPVPNLPDGADPATWYREGADILLDTLGSANFEQPCWNFTKDPRVAGFWPRRQLHETTIHGRDADLSVGAPRAIDAMLAADGVDEVLRTMIPVAQRWGNRMPPPLAGPVLIRLTDTGHAWLLTPDGTPVPTVAGPAVKADEASASITVRGRAEDLLLVLWGRAGLDRVDVEGDAAVLAAFLGGQITP